MLSEKGWRPEAVLSLIAGLFASIFAGGLLIRVTFLIAGSLNDEQQKVVSLVIGTISVQGGAFLLLAWFLRQHQVTWSQAFGFRAPRPVRALILSALTALVALPIALGLGQLSEIVMNFLHMQPVAQQAVQTLQSESSLGLKLYLGLIAVFVAPVCEEMLFRGVIYPTVKQSGFPRIALWGTSLLFALFHVNVMTFVPLLALALALTWLYETTDNLLASILCHSLFNLANFFWLMWDQSNS